MAVEAKKSEKKQVILFCNQHSFMLRIPLYERDDNGDVVLTDNVQNKTRVLEGQIILSPDVTR